MALGGRSEQVIRMLIREVMVLVVIGAAVGLGLALLLGPFMRSFLYGVPPSDLLTLSSVTALLILVALIATWLPARHAAGMVALTALRGRDGS